MGSGKSTIASLLSADYVDMDQVIIDRIGMSISDYFKTYGETAFRQIESQVLQDLTQTDAIIATGGGVITSDVNRQILQAAQAEVIYLKSDFDTLHRQISEDKENIRPLFLSHSRDELQAIYEDRLPLYEAIATQVVPISGKTPEEIVKDIHL